MKVIDCSREKITSNLQIDENPYIDDVTKKGYIERLISKN